MDRLIHCCWFGGPKTKLARQCRDSWGKFAPDWQVHEWNEANVSELKDLPGYVFFSAAIAAKKWAMASDWLRMAVLWKEGGVYFDYDVELVGDLDPICGSGEWIASERTVIGGSWMNPGSGIALEKGSPLARGMIEAYSDLSFDPQRDMMPWINERLCALLRVSAPGRPAPRVLPPEVMSPVDLRGICHRTSATVAIHHYAYSWGALWQRLLRWFCWHGGRGLVDAALRIYWMCGFGAAKTRRKSAIVVLHSAPYRDPVMCELRRRGAEVFSVWGNDVGHDWAGFGDGGKFPVLDGRFLWLRLVWRFVLSRRHALVIWPAYRPWWLTLPILLSALTGVRYALAIDTKEENGGRFARMVKRFIFRRAAFIWVPGEAAARFLSVDYGIPRDRIVRGLYVVDQDQISRKAHPTDGGGKLRFLTVANDVPVRRLETLVKAFESWNRGDAELTLCGRGCSRFGGKGVHGVEGVAWDSLSLLYDAADVYVHNGSEQYSTAVQIAALRGLPVICSDKVGIAMDFGDPTRELLLVNEWCSTAAWKRALEGIASMDPDERRAMGARLRQDAVALYDVGRTVSQIMERIPK